ncbi:hypothetical protein FHP08_10775 [Zeimonas arvi]|uniref:Uncharacterized protein n=1 Tax=Zeimonas arvi TaxID=2498847 RepID=A0A5C8NWL6_9BURK|nr:hypothetical protein FHP08_10775 [Zeimonas arvi]
MDMEAALRDPAAVFASPEAVAEHAELSREQKIEVLRLWGYGASEAEVATEEGMPGGGDGSELLRRIILALDGLIGEVDVGDSAPTKQHAVLLRQGRS